VFIRYFADTSQSDLGQHALEYMRRFMRIYPVRLVSLSGFLDGRWTGYEPLLITPMLGDFINCVCCDPSRWTWKEQIITQKRPVNLGGIGPGAREVEITAPATAETVRGRVDLYTEGKRNILFAVTPPRDKAQLAAAARYEHVVVPKGEGIMPYLIAEGRMPRVTVVSTADGVTNHPTLRQIITGEGL
jgi:hypothetical protein